MPKCSILWCGKYHQNWENDFHSHNFFQLIAILSGSGRVLIENGEYAISKNHVFLLAPQKEHAIYCDAKSTAPLKMLDVKFSVEHKTLFTDLVQVGEHFTLEDFSWLARHFDTILDESEKQRPHYYDLINDYLEIMLVHIIRERLGSGEAAPEIALPPETIERFRGVNIAELMNYIHFNYSKIISLDDLSALAQVNKTTLICIFKELYGTTPIRYINRIRIQKAKELLINTNISVGEIAELIGFQSIHYFSRYFRQKEDCSPIEYRIANTESKYFSF